MMREQDGNEKHPLDGGLDFSARESDVVAGATAQLFHDTVDTAGGGGEERTEFGGALSGAVVFGKNDPCRERCSVFWSASTPALVTRNEINGKKNDSQVCSTS